MAGTRRLSALFGIAIACAGVVTARGPAHAAGLATVTCPTVAADGTVTPAPVPDVDWQKCVLSGASLAGADLDGANLQGANLTGANLTEANLTKANLGGVNLNGANISGANLTGAYLFGVHSGNIVRSTATTLPTDWSLVGGYLMGRGADLADVNLSGLDLSGVDLEETDLVDADLSGATLSGDSLLDADMNGANLSGLDLSGVSLYGAIITDANINGTALAEANLAWVESGGLTGAPGSLPASYWIGNGYLIGPNVSLYRAALAGLDLAGKDLSGVYLEGGDLTGDDLTGADLSSANLIGVNLAGLDMAGANLAKAAMGGSNLSGANLIGTDLASADATNANLTGADLSAATATGFHLDYATVNGANLDAVNLAGGTLTAVISSGITGTPAALPAHWALANGYLVGAEVNLPGVDLAGADLAGVDLRAAHLGGADLANANLDSVSLDATQLGDANLANANLDAADLLSADLSGATVSGATFTGASWLHTTCPDGSSSDKYVAGCFSPLDTTPPVVTITGVIKGKVYVLGAGPTPRCQTTDNGTVATPATGGSTMTYPNGLGLVIYTCSGAVDLAGNKQAAPVRTSFTMAFAMHGFNAPKPGSTIPRAAKTITVYFRPTDVTGYEISTGFAKSLTLSRNVRVTLQGPGIKATTANCGWYTAQAEFSCSIGIPSGVRVGSAQRYTITASENVGSGFVTVLPVQGFVDPEVIHFR